MITAIDSNVLLDVFLEGSRFDPESSDALKQARTQGRLIACDIVWAEVAARFPSPADAARALDILGVTYDPPGRDAAETAASRWREYRRQGGARDRLIPDFLIGAHASHQADRLLTRDRGFFRRYFDGLAIWDPSAT